MGVFHSSKRATSQQPDPGFTVPDGFDDLGARVAAAVVDDHDLEIECEPWRDLEHLLDPSRDDRSVDVRLPIAGQGISRRLFPGDIETNVSDSRGTRLVPFQVAIGRASGIIIGKSPDIPRRGHARVCVGVRLG